MVTGYGYNRNKHMKEELLHGNGSGEVPRIFAGKGGSRQVEGDTKMQQKRPIIRSNNNYPKVILISRKEY